MTNNNLFATTLFTLAIVAVVGFAATLAYATDFAVTLDITNVAPEINYVDSTVTFTPIANSTAQAYLYFNATDENGASDLDDTSAQITITYAAESQTSTGCSVLSSSSTERAYNCTIDIPYYFAAEQWSINASISDQAGASAQNTTEIFTINELQAAALSHETLSFTGAPGDSDIQANQGAQVIYNLGNAAYTALDATGYNLQGVDTSAIINAGNFTMNTIADPSGQSLSNAAAVSISGFSLDFGEAENSSVYVYLSIPAGVEPDVYNSTGNWVLDLS